MRASKRPIFIGVGVLLIGVGVTGCVGFSNAIADPIQRVSAVAIEGLPATTEPIRIALLSDIHAGNAVMRPDRLASIVRSVNEAAPDIVVPAGDFVIGESTRGAARRAENLYPLAGLHARNGVFAVLGNHDHWTNPDAIRRSLSRAGVTVLENDARRIGSIALVGIDDRLALDQHVVASMVNVLHAARVITVGGLV